MKVVLFLVCLLEVLCSSAASECGYQSPVGQLCRYDLSSLTLPGPPYYQYNVSSSAPITYEVNICAPVTSSRCGSPSGACQTQTFYVTGGHESYSLGKAAYHFSDLPEPGLGCSGVRLTYTDGTPCPSAGHSRLVDIDLICSQSNTHIVSVTEPSACHYHIVMNTKEACGEPLYSSSASPSTSMSSGTDRSSSPTRLPSASASLSATSSMPPRNYTPSRSQSLPSASQTLSVTPSPQLSAPPCKAFPITGLLPGFPVSLFGDTYRSLEYSGPCQSRSPTDWYSLKPSSYGNITITTCNSYTNFDTELTVQTGECYNPTCLKSNDDACTSQGSTITWGADPSINYLISVGGSDGAWGKYELVVSFTGNTDPSCYQAVHLPGPFYTPLRVQGTNSHSKPSAEGICGEQTQNRAVWYKFSPALGQEMIVSTCSAHTDFDTLVAIFAGDNCADPLCVAANNNNCTIPNGNRLASTVRFIPFYSSYYAVVYGPNGSVGNYQLYLQQKQGEDPCETATVVNLRAGITTEVTGNTTSASGLRSSVCGVESGKAVWYHVTVPIDMQITIDTCSDYTNFDTLLSVYSGACSDLSCVAYNDDGCGARSRLTITRQAGQDFFAVVSGYSYAEGQFALRFTTYSSF